MCVVKLGGSLLQSPHLHAWVTTIAKSGRGKIILVPGGGLFADQVRTAQKHLQFDDGTAHRMALRAMEQFGLILQNMGSNFFPAHTQLEINDLLINQKIPVWFPYHMLSDNPEIQASWDITSDSLALWLAEKLGREKLILVKSTLPKNNHYSAEYLSQEGYLDKAFPKTLNSKLVQPAWLSHDQYNLFNNLIEDENSLAGLHI